MRLAPRMFRARRTPLRRLSTALATLAAVLIAAGAAAGCDPAAVDRSQLISDLADRLSQSESLTFTAWYELADGATATVSRAQNPSRLALEYPGGRLVLSAQEVTSCGAPQGSMICTVSPASSSSLPEELRAVSSASGLPAPASVAALLISAAVDANAVVDRRDTTLVGLHATCVSVSGLTDGAAFDACVTSDGVLGSFAGTVDGHPVRLTLTRYLDTVDEDAFAPPTGATVVVRPTPSP